MSGVSKHGSHSGFENEKSMDLEEADTEVGEVLFRSSMEHGSKAWSEASNTVGQNL